ncbi:MAG TPA: serine/threonine-protein kinase [Usitatibacter sp.]|nr:serine/threonine-protein kinase [Usitatibacter sp.]
MATPQRFGRYRVVSELGQGAMGVVYRAEDPELGRIVAIKTIGLSGTAQEQDVHQARFRQEARAAGAVSHPAIVTIYDVGREGDLAFIAMEYVEGRELRQLIREGALTPARSLEIAALVADGLAFAHERGVIHRDIKPGNIMVLPDGRVKIMDFGIAHLQESDVKTQSGVLLGSPQYMSPEQVAGQALDGRADIFSLGVVLYEMLTGVKPFDAADLTQLLFWVVNLPHKPPSERNASLPPVIDYIIARALKKNAHERYATAAEFARDLRDCLPEVSASSAAAQARGETQPDGVAAGVATTVPDGKRMPGAESLELRASPRFDSSAALARLPVLADIGTGTRTVWRAATSTLKRRVDRSRALLWGAYAAAALIAVVITIA